jgi:hypothetical protein
MARKRRKNMEAINVKKLGFAVGSTFALLYLGCMLVMAMVGREGTIFFFNSLMHGIDVTSILRMNMPVWEMFIGIIEIFIIAWLTGATIASIYNLGIKKMEDRND